MRRGAVLQLVLFALIAGGCGVAVALGPTWLPEAASREAGRIDFVFWFTIGICIFVFAIVAAALAYAILHFRADPDDDSDGPPIHGHTGLEIIWTLIPTILVVAIGVVSAVVLARNDRTGPNPLRVHVTAQQYAWSFQYPEAGNMQTAIMRLPLDRSVLLDFTSKDVIHSFWVPQFSQKQDVVPGLKTTLHITPTKTGTFPLICTELCGPGHSLMRSTVIVMKPAAFNKWLAAQKQAAGGTAGGSSGGGASSGGGTVDGATVFANNGCGSCHTFKPAGATGTIGPDLDKLATYAKTAGVPLDQFVRESIVSPNAYIQPGYPRNVMPQTFSGLPKPQLDALVQYLTRGKG